ncbi:MAG: NACHT domain-containing protein [Burkholderiales bacterium]|nr:NACHT domain-containing protein [Burkholderiales bacterium]
MLTETLALSLGPAIAKSVIKIWCKDHSLVSDATTAVIDFLAPKLKDQVERKKAARLFERIGEDIAESLIPVFEMEGSRFDPGAIESIAIEVGDTINRTTINPALLLSIDLDPHELFICFQDSRARSSYQFDAAETELFLRILGDVAQNIVDIATQLPTFMEKGIGEILKRETEIYSLVSRVLQEVETIRTEVAKHNPEIELAQFESDYRRTVARRLDEIELYGIDLPPASRKHKLSVAYISLQIETNSLDLTNEQTDGLITSAEEAPLEEPADIAITADPDASDRRVLSVDHALGSCRRWVLRGQAGAGKTTLLQWIAVKSARKEFDSHYKAWNDFVPFLIRLREFSEKPLPQPEAFTALTAPLLAGICPQGWVHRLLKAGRALILVDGVDELPQEQRNNVKTWLLELVKTFPDVVFIVTSRPIAISNSWLDEAGFAEAELLPMEKADIDAFVDHWHNAVAAELTDATLREELPGLAAAFKRAVDSNRAIRNLATTPLLCAMLCALHRERREQIPSSRLELYQICVDALIDRRDIERRIRIQDLPALTLPQKRLILEDFAYWLIENGWSSVSLAKCEERIGRTLKFMLNLPANSTPDKVVRLLVERSGLIRQPIHGEIDFSHRTFQEFLAAKSAVEQGNIGVLIGNAAIDNWREVLILSAGLAKKEDREELLKALIAEGDRKPHLRHRLHLIAVACLETALTLEPEIRSEVQRRVRKLVPPKSLSDANALASAGDLSVPYLHSKKLTALVSACCIRTLGLVASESAFVALRSFRNDERRTVRAELVKAWDRFDRTEYVKQVLSPSTPSNEYLVIRNASSLDGIEHLRNISKVEIINSNVDRLALLPQLRGLRLHSTRGNVDCSDLVHLQSLEILQCYALSISGVRQLSNIASLGSLTLAACSQSEGEVLDPMPKLSVLRLAPPIPSLDLRDFKNLITLQVVRDCPQLDLVLLGSLPMLAQLFLTNWKSLSDVSFLSNSKELSWLSLNGCSALEDISGLAGLKNLRHVDLRGCMRLKTIKPIMHLARRIRYYVPGHLRHEIAN